MLRISFVLHKTRLYSLLLRIWRWWIIRILNRVGKKKKRIFFSELPRVIKTRTLIYTYYVVRKDLMYNTKLYKWIIRLIVIPQSILQKGNGRLCNSVVFIVVRSVFVNIRVINERHHIYLGLVERSWLFGERFRFFLFILCAADPRTS